MADFEWLAPGGHKRLVDNVVVLLAEKPDSDALSPLLTAGAALGITGDGPTESAAWLQRTSTSDGPTTAKSIHGNTVVESGALLSVNMTGIETEDADGNPLQTRTIPAGTMRSAGSVYDEQTATERIVRVGQTTIDGSGVGHWVYSVNVSGDVLQCRVFPVGLATISGSSTNLVATGFTSRVNNSEPYDCYHASDSLRFILPTDAVSEATVAGANAWFAAHPTEVTFKLATPTVTTYDQPLNLTYRTEQGGTERVMVPTGELSAPPTLVTAQGYTAESLRDAALSAIAPVENGIASANYGVGAYLVHGGQLCKVTTAIATGESISIGTNVTATTVMAEVIALIAQ
jgi:hypothetical protein